MSMTSSYGQLFSLASPPNPKSTTAFMKLDLAKNKEGD